jgi:two-component system, NtrC family, sensor kinase
MKIRWKVITLIAILFAILGATEIFISTKVLLPSFAALEQANATISMKRIQFAVDRTLAQLTLSAVSWGNWTDAWRFAQDHNPTFITEQVTAAGLKNLKLNALIFCDLRGHVLASVTLDSQTGQSLDLDLTARETLPADFPWRANLPGGRTAQGFLKTNRGILMLAAAPVLDGFGHGPARGMVIMGRLVSPREIAEIGAQAQAVVSIVTTADSRNRDRQVESADVIHVYHAFDDIYGHPILTLRVDVPREIARRGHAAVYYSAAYLMTAAVLVVALLVILLNRAVLDPLARVTRHAVAIGENKDLTSRLDLKGEDEIGVLAREFDRMVVRVAESRSQLVDQSFQAGWAELAKAVLHNLGNAMIPIAVRLAGIRGHVRAAAASDAQLAIAELARGDTDSTRRADLTRFLQLACDQLARALKAIEDDAKIMDRQVEIVRAALAEQLRMTHNQHVIEVVRLPELLAQSLEVVPDSARQQLMVEADRSLQAIGLVKVPRTILRLVLQNFIINAADSVREAGRAKGSFRVSAEILSEANGEGLYLRCTDDGAGIAQEHLTRVFEKGFSTKPKEANFGIGLHWCANTINGLGGRVWATSEGPGRGATMHLVMPLTSSERTSTVAAA